MTLVFNEVKNNTGTLNGTFTTVVGNCKADMNTPMPITGYFNGNVVTISINFPECKQAIAMTGHLLNDNKDLFTLWADINDVKDPQGQDWNNTISGADHFHAIRK